MQNLVLLRGLPGTGKTTFAETIANTSKSTEEWKHVSADQWRDLSGQRIYKGIWNEVAHDWCFGRTAQFLHMGFHVIVANVFPRLDRIHKYAMLKDNMIAMGHDIRFTVLHVQGPLAGNSVHDGVDYEHYMQEWQDYKGEFN